MDGNSISLSRSAPNEIHEHAASSAERIIEFYEEAGLDYGHWSRGLNMHLGYYCRGLNPFNREKMLEQLNIEIEERLQLDPEKPSFLVDLGCGMGAVSRSIAKQNSNSIIKGVTIVPSQVRIASELNVSENLEKRIQILEGNYTALPFEDRVADGVWAVESACYAAGSDKGDLIRETGRVLRTGGRFVVADCFLGRPEKKLSFLVEKFYRTACKNWALSEMPVLDHFVEALKKNGFSDIVVEDISWRTAPSLAHAPFAALSFLFKKLIRGERLNHHSVNNLTASLSALVLGLNRSKFSYCIISGTRD